MRKDTAARWFSREKVSQVADGADELKDYSSILLSLLLSLLALSAPFPIPFERPLGFTYSLLSQEEINSSCMQDFFM
eukprot:scaffold11745_cov63-Skeletonema_dohrnii-CCMP3373.AAC.1